MHRYLFRVTIWFSCIGLLTVTANGFFQDSVEPATDPLVVPPAPAAQEHETAEQVSNSDATEQTSKSDKPNAMSGQTEDVPVGFDSLFNGKNLDGWFMSFDGLHRANNLKHMSYEEARAKAQHEIDSVWKVSDGNIENLKMGGNLVNKRDFENFECYIDWKLTGDGNSGVYLRGMPQVQIWNDPIGSGGLSNNNGLFRNPIVNRDKPPGEWNRLHILMYGNVVTVVNNGGLVINQGAMENYWNRSSQLANQGPIELQNSEGNIAFRNIFIRNISGEHAINRDVVLQSGQKVKVEEGGFSLNKVLIPVKNPKAGKVVLEGIYNEPITAYVEVSEGKSSGEIADEKPIVLLEVVSTGNKIIISIPESMQKREDLVVSLQILGKLAQLPAEKSSDNSAEK